MRIRSNTYQKVCHLISNNIRDKVKHQSHVVLGLATGSTPIGIYEQLCKMRNTNFGDVITFNLDEYVGLDKFHDQSYQYFMHKHLFSTINVEDLCYEKIFFESKRFYFDPTPSWKFFLKKSNCF